MSINNKQVKGITVETGFICDLCDKEIDTALEPLRPFVVKGIDRLFHFHGFCKHKIEIAAKHQNWRMLPDCSFKQAYFEAMQEQKGSDKPKFMKWHPGISN